MEDIERVLSRVDIVELINSYLPLKRAGRNFKALCPFHSEKTPSFIVSPELQIFKCFGCGQGGNAIKFLSEYEKMTFGEALRFLAEKVGVGLTSYRPDRQEALRDRLYEINHLASEFYHYILTKHRLGEKAREYLARRGVRGGSVEIFKLGYAPAGWENLFNFLVGKKGYKAEDLEKAGLVVKGQRSKVKGQNYYDRFRGRIIFPLFDHRGNIVGFSGRVLVEEEKGAKYINTPETLIYHKSESLYGLLQAKGAIRKKDSLILVEGEFDVISSHQAGVGNVVAIKGSALTENHVKLLKRFTHNFYFCLDPDIAGQEAAKRGIEIAERQGVNIRVINLPEGRDPDQFIRENPTAWHQIVKKTIPVFDFYLSSAIARFGKEGAEAAKKVAEEVLPIFNKITNEVVKAHYFAKLANILGIGEEAVAKEAKRLTQKEKISPWIEKSVQKETPKPRKELLEEYLLSLILQSSDSFETLQRSAQGEYLTCPAVKRVFSYLAKYRQGQKEKPFTFQPAEFVKILPEELKETVDRLFLLDLQGLAESETKLKKEWRMGWREVEKLFLHDKLGKLREVLENREKTKEEKKKAEEEIMGIVKKLKA